MEVRANYVLAGSFVIGLLACLFLALIWFASKNEYASYRPYDIYFTKSVAGLDKDAPVRFRGIPVGNVTDIRIDPENAERTRVTIRIADETPVKEDTVATLNYQGVTGVAYIELIGGKNTSPKLEVMRGQRHPVIASRSSDLQKVFESTPDMIAQFTQVAARASALLSDKNLAAFSTSLENMQQVTSIVAGRTAEIDRLIGNSAIAAERIVRASASLEHITGQINHDLPQTLQGISHATDNFAASSRDVQEMINENRAQITGGVGELNHLIRESRDAVVHIKGLTKDLKSNPSRIIYSHEHKGVEIAP